ncbi:MAG: hypothetical protein AAGI63_17400 [Planctomycetota bacterium]
MNRWLLIGSLAMLLVGSTGCLHHNLRGGCDSGACGSCNSGTCGNGCNSGMCGGGCNSGACGNGCNHCGDLSRLGGLTGVCNHDGCRNGCVAGPLGWQQGGLNYSSHLHPPMCGHGAGKILNNRPFTPGPPSAQVGYPYYTVRGPRDFLVDNPPSIGR